MDKAGARPDEENGCEAVTQVGDGLSAVTEDAESVVLSM